jgi:lipopolysaccharide biosynthesis glycosyltransferase
MAFDDAGIPSSYRKEIRSYFNSGVLFFRPNNHHFTRLVHLSSNKTVFNMLEYLTGKHSIWLDQTENLRIIHFAGSHKPYGALHSTNEKKFNANLIRDRFFTTLITEKGWRKEDLLVPLVLKTLRGKFKYDQ